jgi:hypothetical protein
MTVPTSQADDIDPQGPGAQCVMRPRPPRITELQGVAWDQISDDWAPLPPGVWVQTAQVMIRRGLLEARGTPVRGDLEVRRTRATINER